MSPKDVDWLSNREQQTWFDKFKSKGELGLKLNKFQEFLEATLYKHLKTLSNGESQPNDWRLTYQQEMQLFKILDSNNDHILDREEFSRMCQFWLHKTFHRSAALVIVDVQNDFIDGSLALINGPAEQDGADVIPIINNLLDRCPFEAVVYTQDWHPVDHIGFHENIHLRKYHLKAGVENGDSSNVEQIEKSRDFRLRRLNPKVRVFDTVLFDDGRIEQKLWPVHCVQDSWGAQLHPKLRIIPGGIRIYKGTLSHVDAYSAFWDNMRLNETGLRQELSNRNIDDVFFCGLALDYCVAASALDSAKAGFMTFVIEDACKGIDNEQMEKSKKDLIQSGVLIITSDLVSTYCLNPKLLVKISYKIALGLGGFESK